MHLLYPQAKGDLAPSLLLLWESQGFPVVFPGRVLWSSCIRQGGGWGGVGRKNLLLTHWEGQYMLTPGQVLPGDDNSPL